mgnify:CR=1 FL=1
MLNSKMREAIDLQELICVSLNDSVDNFLIGILEGCDEDGLLLLNVDYRGIATGHVYLSMAKVNSFMEKPEYVGKIKILCNKKGKLGEIISFPHGRKLLDSFLKWVCTKHKMLRITFPDEQITGYICRMEEESILLDVVDNFTGEPDGKLFIRKEHLMDVMSVEQE